MPSFFDSFPFALFVWSSLSTKFLHLFLHASSVSIFGYIVFLPSFFVSDVIFISIARILLRRERNILSTIGYTVGLTITLITLGAASSQLGFYIETGGEIEWDDAGAFAGDEEGMKVLMDGAKSVGFSMLAIILAAWCTKAILYRIVGDALAGLGSHFASVWNHLRRGTSNLQSSDLEDGSYEDSMTDHSYRRDSNSDLDTHERQNFLENDREKHNDEHLSNPRPRWGVSVLVITGLVYLGLVALARPEKPYNHMSTTLPWPLLDAYKPAMDPCEEKVLVSQNKWPLPGLTSKKYWQKPRGDYKGWAPGVETRSSRGYKKHFPHWLPQPAPPGFRRWDPQQPSKSKFTIKLGQAENKEDAANMSTDMSTDICAVNITDDSFYSPVTDPLRITNLDDDVLGPLKEALKDDSVKVKHVVFVLMESMREELFPLQQGSDLHRFILDTHSDEDRKELMNSRTAQLTPNAERITGKSGNFVNGEGRMYDLIESGWKDKTQPGFGGINVVGGLTASSVSTKSLAALHCGVWPLPVDKFKEAELSSYQPCLPQILNLFNQHKHESESQEDFVEQKWSSAFFQATTDHYDHQHQFDDRIGFEHTVTKTDLAKKRLGGDIDEINYFGYPETALKPYIEEYINKTLSENKRMFLSHFTSTTHHPWGVPEDFNTTRYMSLRDSSWHKDMNSYLNTVKFVDSWLGEMMQILDDFGISDETLVVFVGDHGQAFREDTRKTGTYENGHVSNFRVPITLRHPKIPRIQYEANATSVSLLPTVLDLLINTRSVNGQDRAIASDIMNDYEGQSLIRPYKTQQDGRRAWNFGIVNAGGGMLTVTSADAPWRLVMPLGLEVAYTLTDLRNDPLELKPLSDWTLEVFLKSAEERFGPEAAVWAKDAEEVSRWWVTERKRLWGYNKK